MHERAMRDKLRRVFRSLVVKRGIMPFRLKDKKQRDILRTMQKDGICLIDFDELFNQTQFQKLQEEFEAFSIELQKRETSKSGTLDYKEFIKSSSALKIDTPFLLSLGKSETLFNIARAYIKFPIKLAISEYWLTEVSSSKLMNSQNWHADPEGEKIIKVFIYFNNIDATNGAMQYVKGSHYVGRNRSRLKGINEKRTYYPDNNWVNAEFENDIITAKAKRGTIVIADTRGLHRGGNCVYSNRKTAVIAYFDILSSAKALN